MNVNQKLSILIESFKNNVLNSEKVNYKFDHLQEIQQVATEAIHKYGGGPFKLIIKKYIFSCVPFDSSKLSSDMKMVCKIAYENLVKKGYCEETLGYAIAVFGVERGNILHLEEELKQAESKISDLQKLIDSFKKQANRKIEEIEFKDSEEEPLRGMGGA